MVRSKSSRKARKFRFYQAVPITVGDDLQLDKAASHHLLTVLRASEGDEVQLFNGDGFDYSAQLIRGGKGNSSKLAVLQIASRSKNHSESPLAITLVQAVSRGEKMDQCIRQAVELGVHAIVPLYSRHAQTVADEKRAMRKQQHWHSIIVSAAEQSGRSTVPRLHPSLSLPAWIEQESQGLLSAPCLVLHPHASSSIKALSISNTLSIVIGPESGFDQDEIDAMVNAGAQACQLGPRTLRTETAGPASIAILQSLYGDGI